MTRPKEYHTRVPKTLNFEMNVYEEFQELCKKEDISISKKVQDFMIETIQKNALGVNNPIGVSYITYTTEKHKPSQSDLRMWLPREEAITKARKMPFNANEWKHLAQTFHIIAEKKRTGYL